jgi:REP element-mobilizing transposase RayT
VSGHGFSRAVKHKKKTLPCAAGPRAATRSAHKQFTHTIIDVIKPRDMARPSRNTNRDDIQNGPRTFFVTSRTIEGRSLLQTERMANLFIDVLRTYVTTKKFRLHDFVAMPNHFHLQLTLDGRKTIEKAVGLVKGNFSYRAKKELGYQFEIWQPGFSDERVWDRESFLRHRSYIDNNPVKAGLADKPENYPYGSAYFRARKKALRA